MSKSAGTERNIKMPTLARRFSFPLKIIILLVLALITFVSLHRSTFAAACASPSTNYGADTMTVSVPSSGSYTLWVRMYAPDTTNNSINAEVDGTTCFNVGGSSSIPANSWTWVNYQNGATNTPNTVTLSAGDHAVKLIGTKPGVEVDRILLLSDTCVPTGTGTNCDGTVVTPPPTPPPPTPTPPSSPPASSGIVGDLNNDGTVDIFDLSILLSKYNTSDTTADLNADNTVNIFDLSILLSHYDTSTQTGDCLASNNCYPKPVNSGVGATGVPPGHTPASGCTASPASGAVLTDCLFTGTVHINTTGSGATYRYSSFVGQIVHDGTGTLTVEYSTFGPSSGCNHDDNAFVGSDYTVRFSRFNEHVHEGPRVADSNIVIEDNFIGPMCSNSGDHSDGIQGYYGGTNVLIKHNTIDQRTALDHTSPIFIANDSESADVEDNLVAGGGYTLRLHDDFTPDHGPWMLLGNRIVDKAWDFGPMNNSGTSFTASTCSDNRLVEIDSSYNITSLGSVVGC